MVISDNIDIINIKRFIYDLSYTNDIEIDLDKYITDISNVGSNTKRNYMLTIILETINSQGMYFDFCDLRNRLIESKYLDTLLILDTHFVESIYVQDEYKKKIKLESLLYKSDVLNIHKLRPNIQEPYFPSVVFDNNWVFEQQSNIFDNTIGDYQLTLYQHLNNKYYKSDTSYHGLSDDPYELPITIRFNVKDRDHFKQYLKYYIENSSAPIIYKDVYLENLYIPNIERKFNQKIKSMLVFFDLIEEYHQNNITVKDIFTNFKDHHDSFEVLSGIFYKILETRKLHKVYFNQLKYYPIQNKNKSDEYVLQVIYNTIHLINFNQKYHTEIEYNICTPLRTYIIPKDLKQYLTYIPEGWSTVEDLDLDVNYIINLFKESQKFQRIYQVVSLKIRHDFHKLKTRFVDQLKRIVKILELPDELKELDEYWQLVSLKQYNSTDVYDLGLLILGNINIRNPEIHRRFRQNSEIILNYVMKLN